MEDFRSKLAFLGIRCHSAVYFLTFRLVTFTQQVSFSSLQYLFSRSGVTTLLSLMSFASNLIQNSNFLPRARCGLAVSLSLDSASRGDFQLRVSRG